MPTVTLNTAMVLVHHRLRPRKNCKAFCMSGAFLGLNDEVDTVGTAVGRPPLRTLGAAAKEATRAAGLALVAKAVPCCACKQYSNNSFQFHQTFMYII